ncbi:response regulator [Methanoplanus endosymbiosus]|uniref:Response regulator n=1 Tax=Methanoplanus endosymbiosus TaxID=33865 RepID=A0A9E7PM13_9EURY|nr:response regulator [Methanoplanus endosymbiosus]UUX92663.1 response regulator [Methanoplanus endosymbiosus]
MMKIMMVDNEPGILQVGQIFLRKMGQYDVKTAKSAIEALEILKENKFDAVISGYQMPDMNGSEFLKEFRKRDSDTPFIIFSTWDANEMNPRPFTGKADYYVRKSDRAGKQFEEINLKIISRNSGMVCH